MEKKTEFLSGLVPELPVILVAVVLALLWQVFFFFLLGFQMVTEEGKQNIIIRLEKENN